MHSSWLLLKNIGKFEFKRYVQAARFKALGEVQKLRVNTSDKYRALVVTYPHGSLRIVLEKPVRKNIV